MNVGMIISFNVVVGFIYPILAIHLNGKGMSDVLIGVMFAVVSLTYAAMAAPVAMLKIEK